MASRMAVPTSRSTAKGRIALSLAAAALISVGLLAAVIRDVGTILLLTAMLAGAGAIALLSGLALRRVRTPAPPDRTLLHGMIATQDSAAVLVDRAGRMVTANPAYERLIGGYSVPPAIGDPAAWPDLEQAARVAWRDGRATIAALAVGDALVGVTIERIGVSGDHLLWRFEDAAPVLQMHHTAGFVSGGEGALLGQAGVPMALVDADGRLVAANPALLALIPITPGMPLTNRIDAEGDGWVRLSPEPESPLFRLSTVGLGTDERRVGTLMLFVPLAAKGGAVIDDPDAAGDPDGGQMYELLGTLPLGLALVDRDGRVQFMNAAFRRVAGLSEGQAGFFPSELVVNEDAAVVAEAVRRASTGRARTTDLAVRLDQRPDEPIGLTIAPVRDMGAMTALLSIKDNAEESRLRRQVAQATKMQAVGQLAGGVAHDFNNILTGILGHCDLMLMRHSPGDSDYDDIQQIKHNSNRAASLTRQLLAFSRQQTLRPQVLQLPDVISEISNLLKRLLGETVSLEVKHGRNLGPVRADPGQLEQVIVNLAVNARDAMPGGGTLTLQTYAVPMAEAQKIENDILPAADYTALSISDTGTGIAPELIGKIFEPFFTTKEVGKGTGLGLSTVYGIVKQTGGYIFADSEVGKGTVFTLYLPIHHGDALPDMAPAIPPAKPQELWGSGTILLVEDEAMVRAVAERALTRQGYTVHTATNGEEALDLLDRCDADGVRIDLLITDVVMPVMDGPTLVGHARHRFPDLPILFMSGYAEEQLRNSIDIGNVAFLAKPFSVQQLGEAAQAALAGESEVADDGIDKDAGVDQAEADADGADGT